MASDAGNCAVEVRAVEHPESQPGQRALEVLDRVLAEKPNDGTTQEERKTLGDDFSETTRLICGYRDILIHAQRKAGATTRSRNRLQRINSVLSTVLGGHFPLGDVPWQQVERARDELAALVAEG